MPVGVIAGLFPGQGSQTRDLRAIAERNVPELTRRAIDLVGEDPFARVSESTRFAQPAIYCATMAGWTRFQRARFYSCRLHVVLAGHSLGELSALVAAGAIDPVSGLELAVLRGELMASAEGNCEEEGMLAVLRAPDELPSRLAAEHGLTLANDNAPGQVVLSGPVHGLREAADEARTAGARAIWLDVTGAFHSPAMAGAVDPFRAALEQVELRDPTMSVISSSTARPFEDIPVELAAAIVQPVRWRATMLALAQLGADTFVDLGPGEILAKLVPRNLPTALVLNPSLLSPAAKESSRVA